MKGRINSIRKIISNGVNMRICLALTILIVLGITTEQAWGEYGGGGGIDLPAFPCF